ncbi:PaaI family thioesterase [Anaerotignum lactatifermentans]|uniref:PaaI family thioesterase n=1 Tax=Anaerotignum lactatifermentans TaxID=160404 RepID=A0ABS2GA31_9FIRM|nr:PaaI family thioesterase [Anaerotignum lactatifermentans]MBM6830076.1 PaaI family thioesterase [Anaerotignum lactatifermentans]MBM6878319.1 PaaI family thioesterase [Anaerotignum lactatifermentans]MBM6951474.1 PaaI family thioesterase [Anaerotignum lactatifermentans]
MIYLTEEHSSQEEMLAWLKQLENPEFGLIKDSVLQLLQPKVISCDYENRTAEFAFAVQEWQLNPEKGLHGGIIVTGFDVSFGLLCHYYAKQHMISTISIDTTFLKPVMETDTIHYKVRINRMGHTIYHLTAEARLERDDILAAVSNATFMKLEQTFPTPV